MSDPTIMARDALVTVRASLEHIRALPRGDARDHAVADLNCYVSEVASTLGADELGDWLFRVYWMTGGLLDYWPVAQVFGLPSSVLKWMLGK